MMSTQARTRAGLRVRLGRGLAAAALVATTALLGSVPPASAASDEKAVAVAERVMEALGGEAAWKRTRFLRFDFAVDRGGATVMRRASASPTTA